MKKEDLKEENDSFDSKEDQEPASDDEINISKGSNNLLEKINENDEDNYSTNRETVIKDLTDSFLQEQPPEDIHNLKLKIKKLEEQVATLKKKNDTLTKDNIHNDKKMKRMSFVGTRKKFAIGSQDNCDKIKMAELLKEKNDLQEINEKMLNMLTEKELENEELQENYTNYQNEMKIEIQNYIDYIEELEEKISENNQNKGKNDFNYDEIVEEHNKYKEKMKKELNEHIKRENELNNELYKKENYIQELKSDIDNLEIDNKQLKNLTEQKKDEYNKELIDINNIKTENEKLKNEIARLQEKIKNIENRNQANILSKEKEIKTIKEDLEYKVNSFNKIKEENSKEIQSLKDELNKINKSNKDINSLIKKYESLNKENEEIKNNMTNLQNKLDKKTKELQEINDSAKKILENKENIIKEYEKEIEGINKDKNKLIEQNRNLLDKINSNNYSSNPGELSPEDKEKDTKIKNLHNEIILLKAETKALKEQLENQANDLISLNAMEREVSRLKLENEKLEKDNKTLKKQKLKFESNDSLINLSKALRINSQKKNKFKNTASLAYIKDKEKQEKQEKHHKDKHKSERKKMVQIERIKYTEEKIQELPKESDEIDKLKEEMTLLKVQFLNKEFENETAIAKYKSIIKSIIQNCKQHGINLNLDVNNI
jgi:chromosome segregation ATPase